MGGWNFDDDVAPTEAQTREAKNAQSAYQATLVLAEALLTSATRALTADDLCALQRIFLDGLPRATNGAIRTQDVVIASRTGETVFYEPPPHAQVASQLAEALAYLNAQLRTQPIHAAAYALWRINAIHPWADGNGRVSRSVCYAVLCVGLGRLLPGRVTVPELIARRRYDVTDGLIAADRAFAAGRTDVDDLEKLLVTFISEQITSSQDTTE